MLLDAHMANYDGMVDLGLARTFTFALVLHIQFGHSFTFGLEQGTFVLVGLSIQATDGALPGDVGAVWGAHTAWLVLLVHLTLLSGTTVDILARLWEWTHNVSQEFGWAFSTL